MKPLYLSLLALCLFDPSLSAAEPPQVFRNFMPDAGPSAFAVVLSPEWLLCYDPLRGGINQIWQGSLDLSPTRRAKINGPANIDGKLFYTENTLQPLRVNQADQPPLRRFKGYRYLEHTVVFEFILDGIPVQETLSRTADGRGLLRQVSVPPGTRLYFQADPQPQASLHFSGATEIQPGLWLHEATPENVFTQQILPASKS